MDLGRRCSLASVGKENRMKARGQGLYMGVLARGIFVSLKEPRVVVTEAVQKVEGRGMYDS